MQLIITQHLLLQSRQFIVIYYLEYIVALGPNIVDTLRMGLKRETCVTDSLIEFVPPGVSLNYFDDVANFVLLIYAMMRGEDFAMKLLKKNASLKLPVRQIQVVLFDPKHLVKIKGETNLVDSEETLQNTEFVRTWEEVMEE